MTGRARPSAIPAPSGDVSAAAAAAAAAETLKVVNRLKRAQGQLAGVIRMLEQGRSCEEVVTQLSAVSKAVDRAGFAIIASGMEQCLLHPDDEGSVRVETLQKLFLSLA